MATMFVGFEHETNVQRFWNARRAVEELVLSLHPHNLTEFGRHAAGRRARADLATADILALIEIIMLRTTCQVVDALHPVFEAPRV
jgi:hypothetical protein